MIVEIAPGTLCSWTRCERRKIDYLLGGANVVRKSTGVARYARLCVKLAQEADTPELREQLFQQAREWMRAVLEHEDAERSVN